MEPPQIPGFSPSVPVWRRAAFGGVKTLLYVMAAWAPLAVIIAFSEKDLSLTPPIIFSGLLMFPLGLVTGAVAAGGAAGWRAAASSGFFSALLPASINIVLAGAAFFFAEGEDLKFAAIGSFCGAGWLVFGLLGGLARSLFARRD